MDIDGQFDDAPEPLDSAKQQTSVAASHLHHSRDDDDQASNECRLSRTVNPGLNNARDLNGWGQFDDAPEPPFWSTEQPLFAVTGGDQEDRNSTAKDKDQCTLPVTPGFPFLLSKAGCNSCLELDPTSLSGAEQGTTTVTRRSPPKLPSNKLREDGNDTRDISLKKIAHYTAAGSDAADAVEGFVAAGSIFPEDSEHRYPVDDKNVTVKDVLFGRGGKTNTHPGNVFYRNLVSKYRIAYQTAKKNDKNALSKNLVHFVRSQQGRFLKRSDSDLFWYEVGDEKAIAKTGQALREGMAELIRSSLQGQSANDSEVNVSELLMDNDSQIQRRENVARGRKRQRIPTNV